MWVWASTGVGGRAGGPAREDSHILRSSYIWSVRFPRGDVGPGWETPAALFAGFCGRWQRCMQSMHRPRTIFFWRCSVAGGHEATGAASSGVNDCLKDEAMTNSSGWWAPFRWGTLRRLLHCIRLLMPAVILKAIQDLTGPVATKSLILQPLLSFPSQLIPQCAPVFPLVCDRPPFAPVSLGRTGDEAPDGL